MLNKLVCTEQKAKFKPNFLFGQLKRFLQGRTSTLDLNERKKVKEKLWIFILIGVGSLKSMRHSCIF